MISEVRLPPKAHIVPALVAFLALPCNASSQPASEIAEQETQQYAVATILEIEGTGEPNSADLIEPLTTLGLFYELEGDNGAAVAAFQRARDIIRVNYGFQTLDEAAVIQRLVVVEEARGNVEAAWDLEQDLLELVSQSFANRGSEEHPSDVRIAPILSEIADRRMSILDRYRDGEFPLEIVLGCYYDKSRLEYCNSGSSVEARNAIAAEANWYRAAAIRTILENELYASDQLRALETRSFSHGRDWSICPAMSVQELMEIELLGSCLDPIIRRSGSKTTPDVVFANVGGEAARMRYFVYEARSGASAQRQASALVRLADWQIRFPFVRRDGVDRYGNSALELYGYAYQLLHDEQDSEATIDELFSPEIPIVLETFGADPLTFEAIAESTEYIDVEFAITKFGHGENVVILTTTPNVSRRSERHLTWSIEHSAFRPRLSEGQFSDSSRVVARYFLQE